MAFARDIADHFCQEIPELRVAYVHDWLVTYRGGEKVLEVMLNLFPKAPIYTLFYDPHNMPYAIRQRKVIYPRTLNALKSLRKPLLPVLPRFIESFSFDDFDLVISSSSCVAKGIRPGRAKHLCYIHSPMRYIWDQKDHYNESIKHIPFAPFVFRKVTESLQEWDSLTAKRVDRFIVNSTFVGKRVREYYQRDSKVIHPPVDIERFGPNSGSKSDYYLAAGALVPYKRFDLALEACKLAKKRLIVAGSGPELTRLKHRADDQTSFVIDPSDEVWTSLLQGAKALLFPGVEDFGLTAIEALACGTPLIAFRGGGALDFVVEGKTGTFFDTSSAESLASRIENFDPLAYDAMELNQFAKSFHKARFLEQLKSEVDHLMS
jgi:glycosyltransferase involved in cell wall biosynthesis